MIRFSSLHLISGSILLSLVMARCSTKKAVAEQESEIHLLESPKAYLRQSTASEADLKAFAKTSNIFSFALFPELAKDNSSNLIYSPLSIRTAFSLLLPGSVGTAEAEIVKALGFSLPQENFHETMKAQLIYLQAIDQRLRSKSGKKDKFKFSINNNLWVDRSEDLQEDYLDTLKVSYNCGVNTLDFRNQPEESRLAINSHILKATDGLIKDLLPSQSLTGKTRLVLTNSVFFHADWLNPFANEATQNNSTFTTASGSKVKVSMMNQKSNFKYFEAPTYQAVSLPYVGSEIAMMVILPKDGGLAKVNAAMSSEEWDKILTSGKTTEVQLSLPKFALQWGSVSLKDGLGQLGLKSVFEPSKVNFSKLLKESDKDLFISNVFHQATLIVNEKGTTAAAATAVIVGDTESDDESEPIIMKVDHPALFILYDIRYGAILFAGQLANP